MINDKELMLISDQIESCTACNFRKQCRLPIIPEFYPDLDNHDIQLMIVADRISFEEETCSTAWFDRDKEYVRRLIHSIFPSKLTYFTYLVKCFVGSDTILGKKNTSICYKTHLLQEIDIIKPKFVLTLGKLSGKILLGKYSQNPKPGNIFIGQPNCGNWKSPFSIFNEGKQKETKFIEYLKKIQTTITVL